MKISLSEAQKLLLEEQHRTERDRRICDWNTILPDLPDRINDNFQKLKPVVSV
jgi:hypothetical protein